MGNLTAEYRQKVFDQQIIIAMAKTGGVKKEAAAIVGLSESQIYREIRRRKQEDIS